MNKKLIPYVIGTDSEYILYTKSSRYTEKANSNDIEEEPLEKMTEASNFKNTDEAFKKEIQTIKSLSQVISSDPEIVSKITSKQSFNKAVKNEYLTGSVYTKRTVKRGVGAGLTALAAAGLGVAAYKNGGLGNIANSLKGAFTDNGIAKAGLESILSGNSESKTDTPTPTNTTTSDWEKEQRINNAVTNTMQGKYGNGEERIKNLKAEGFTDEEIKRIQTNINNSKEGIAQKKALANGATMASSASVFKDVDKNDSNLTDSKYSSFNSTSNEKNLIGGANLPNKIQQKSTTPSQTNIKPTAPVQELPNVSPELQGFQKAQAKAKANMDSLEKSIKSKIGSNANMATLEKDISNAIRTNKLVVGGKKITPDQLNAISPLLNSYRAAKKQYITNTSAIKGATA